MKTAKILIPAALIVVLAAIALALPVGAAPFRQDLPTPTPEPVENTPYTLETVGGAEETLTFPGAEGDGITIGETSVTSHYPRGMEFTVTAESTGGDIVDVILFQRYAHGSGTRVVAQFDAERNVWVAYPWETGANQPAWTHFDFYWRVRDASDVSIETEPQPIDYSDPTRPWYRMESDLVILYWFGFGDDDPDAIAQHMADVMASTQSRRVAGFGRELSYKPMAIVYPSREALAETSGAGVERTRVAGYTSSDLGVSVQILRDTSLVPGNENCVWALKPEDWTMERRINTIFTTTTHEVVHLYQYDILGGPLGDEWWTEGIPEWFSYAPGMYDQRLRNLATLQDIPSLESGGIGSDLTQADGCYALSYDVGPSFINYLLTNYGGPETHRQIAELMRANSSIFEAVETVTGKPFLEIENEWRTYLGFPVLDLADIDPSAALEPAIDPVAEVGDTVTLPAVPVMPVVHANAGPNQPTSGQCFANTAVEILQIGSLDGVDYYQVDCMGQIGWMDRGELVGPGN